MTSTTIHRTCKQRRFSSIVIATASLLFIFTTFMGFFNSTTAYGAGLAQQEEISRGTTFLLNVKKPTPQASAMDLVVFFTRPVSCEEDPVNCSDRNLFKSKSPSYAPNDALSCEIPIPQSQQSPQESNSWVIEDKMCPYLNCNWMSTSDGCRAQTDTTKFFPSPITSLGNAYMRQTLDFKNQPQNNEYFGFSGCIYYGNWPEFPVKTVQFVLFGSEIQLYSGTLPDGVTLQGVNAALLDTPEPQGWKQ